MADVNLDMGARPKLKENYINFVILKLIYEFIINCIDLNNFWINKIKKVTMNPENKAKELGIGGEVLCYIW